MHVIIVHRVILEAAIVASGRISGSHKHADGNRHGLFVDQLVEHGRGVVQYAILRHIDAGRLRRIILLRHIERVAASRSRKDLAPRELVRGEIAFGNRGGIFRRRKTCQKQGDSHELAKGKHVAFHRFSNDSLFLKEPTVE